MKKSENRATFILVSIKIVVFSLKVTIAFPLDKLFTPQIFGVFFTSHSTGSMGLLLF